MTVRNVADLGWGEFEMRRVELDRPISRFWVPPLVTVRRRDRWVSNSVDRYRVAVSGASGWPSPAAASVPAPLPVPASSSPEQPTATANSTATAIEAAPRIEATVLGAAHRQGEAVHARQWGGDYRS
jgi:hypothetical protein